MQSHRACTRRLLLGLGLAAILARPASAVEKIGMPDLGQEAQTCLPTSTANLIVWFGTHGYPKLIVSGDSADDGYIHTVHALMTATNARYDLGTRPDAITYGISKYIRAAGYSCEVEYRGMDWSMARYPQVVQDPDEDKYRQDFKPPDAFTQDWLKENDNPNKGFILLLAYIKYDEQNNTFTDAIHAGHAVTLVNVEPDMLLVHDPAHYSDMPGRKILTPELLTGGTFQLPGYAAPVSGLLLLSGTMLQKPHNAGVMLTGAVCITMHPVGEGTKIIGSASGAPNDTVAGNGAETPASTPTAPAAPTPAPSTSWMTWLFDFFFKK